MADSLQTIIEYVREEERLYRRDGEIGCAETLDEIADRLAALPKQELEILDRDQSRMSIWCAVQWADLRGVKWDDKLIVQKLFDGGIRLARIPDNSLPPPPTVDEREGES